MRTSRHSEGGDDKNARRFEDKIRAKDKTGKRGTKFDVVKPKDWKAPNIEKIIEEEREINENFSNRI